MKRIILMRHAQAGSAATDVDRELTVLGREQCVDTARELAVYGPIDFAEVSGAKRARQTYEGLVSAGLEVADVKFVNGLYDIDERELADRIRETDERHSTILIIGHEPTVSGLALLFGDGQSETSRTSGYGLRAGAAVVLDYDGTWADIENRSMSAIALIEPRDF